MRTQGLAFSSALVRQFRALCTTSKRSSVGVAEECVQLANLFGAAGFVSLFLVLLEEDHSGKHNQRLKLLEEILLEHQVSVPDVCSSLCQALLRIGSSPSQYFKDFTQGSELPVEFQVQFGLAVCQTSFSLWREEGLWLLRDAILRADRHGHTLSVDAVHDLLCCAAASEGILADCEGELHRLSISQPSIPSILCPFIKGSEIDLYQDLKAQNFSISQMTSQLEMANSLAGVMEEHGYSCSSTEAIFQAVIGRVGSIDESAVAKVIGMMARTHTGLDDSGMLPSLAAVLGNAGESGNGGNNVSTWNADLVVDILKSRFPNLVWTRVVEELDHEGFHLPDRQAFLLVMRCLNGGLASEPFPLHAILSRVWDNYMGQLSFLNYAVTSPPEVFSFEKSRKKLSLVEGLQGGRASAGNSNHAWVSLDLAELLCQLGDGGQAAGVRQVLDAAKKNCPEALLLLMASVRNPWGIVQREVCGSLIPLFLRGHSSSTTVLRALWDTNKEEVVQSMVDLYLEDAAHIPRILDVCQELKSLTMVLNSSNYAFASELAALASRREYLNLEKWLKDKISSDGLLFVEAVLSFLDAKLVQQVQQGQTTQAVGRVNLSMETLVLFLRVLHMNASVFPPELSTEISQVESKALKIYPQLQVLHEQGEQAEVFASDIENEANSYFQKIYSEQTRLDDVIQMLKLYKSSSEQREQEVFACMVHNLFDEYRFFPKYPDKELNITAVLFGQLIHHQLVSSITLGIALRYVLDALRKPSDSKMFNFGVRAIQQFKSELPAWPQYCQHVLEIPQVRETDPGLVQYIEAALREQGNRSGDSQAQESPMLRGGGDAGVSDPNGILDDANLDSSAVEEIRLRDAEAISDQLATSISQGDANGGTVERPSPSENGTHPNPPAESTSQPTPPSAPSLAAINAQTLEVAALEYCTFSEPQEKIRDKVAFVFNNLSPSNMADKIQLLRETVEDEHTQWLANYVVVKRAAQEVNFHPLYLRLVEEMGNKRLVEHIIQTTYHYVKVLLEKDRIKHEMSDRSLLKNLGSWLGQLTLAKNKPVRQKDMDLKAIMFEAYEKGKMVAVIPFVHKVLEQGKESRVYGSSNPWIKGILTLLAEIYRLEGLKMNLTFEIEMIFKDFNLNIGEIPASKSLDGMKRDNNSNPDFYDTRDATPSSQPPVNASKPELPGPADVSSQPSPSESTGAGLSPQMISVPGLRNPGLDPTSEPVPPGPRIGPNMSSSFKPGMVPPITAPGPGVQQVVATDAASILSALAGNLHQLVTINPTLSALAQTVPLKRLISVGIDRAIYEIITPVVERSVMIACTTTKELVTKDFAMEPDEQKLRKAAHLMVSSLSGSLALVTCKEPLKVSLQSQLKEVLQDVLDPGLLDQTINIVITDNLDLGCTIIEKASTDKAIKEVDERLLPYYQSRQKARAAGTPFYDMSIFTRGGGRFPASLPESLRPKPGHLHATQTRVYDDFARIPRPNQHLLRLAGIAESPVTQMDQPDSMLPFKPTTLADRYAHWQARLDAILSKENPNTDYSQLESSEITGVISELGDVVLLGQNREDVVTGIAEKLFVHMYDRPTRLAVTVLCAALSMLKNAGFSRLANHVTTWYCQISQDESRRFNQIVADGLVRANLMVFPELDLFLARCVSNHCGPHPQSVDFILYLLHQYIMVEHLIRASDLASTLEVLRKLALQSPDNERIIRLIDQVRNVQKDADPEGLRDQVAALFDNWAKVVNANPTDNNITTCVEQFIRRGLLKGDDITSRFFRICAELSVLHCVNTEAVTQQQQKVGDGRMSYVMIDSFVKLVVTLLDVLKGGIQGLRKILEIIVLVLYRDHDDRGTLFNSRPYFRIFYGLFQELLPSDLEEPGALDILGVLASALVSCRPQRAPGFTFSWLELVSHHLFMPRLLKYPDRRGWSYFRALFMGLLLFMQPYLRHAELGEILRLMYKGVMRVMLVLLHDFPEFLCDYHVELCNVIPPSCVQMRNLILSAFPSHMRLPDPFTPNLKVDLLPDINKEPKIFPDVSQLLPADLKNGIDQYIKSHGPPLFLENLPQRLMLSPEAQKVEGTAYNVTIMNCVVLYTGILAIRAVRNTNSASLVQYGPAMDIFHKLANDLDTEGRYLFLNAIANQLRFPNSHTHYFSCVLLVLFLEAQERVLQEQITRVLLERLIVHRPHPWGLLITFIELIKNKRYSFWDLGITRCAPEIGQLFDSVARSCLPAPPEGMVQDENGVAVQSAERALDPGS